MKTVFPGNQLTHLARVLGIAAAIGGAAVGCAAQSPAADPTPPQSSATAVTATPVNQAQPVPAPNEPNLTIRDQKVLETFEPAAHEEYTLGAGDDITLDFPGHPDLNCKQTVGPDGRISLKNVEAIQVADLTRAQAAKAIQDALSKDFVNPVVTISVDKYSSNRVRVIGYVQHPGEVLFEDTPTLLDAIGRAGLITPTIILPNGTASSVGPGVPDMCIVYRGSDVVEVQLRELLVSGSALADMRLRRNDIVYVPEPKQLFVSVLGQVGKPGTIPLTKDSTLTSVLAQAGCCNDPGGFNPLIQITSPVTGKVLKIQYKKLLTIAGQQEYALHTGDVIYVPVSGFNRVTSVIQKISPVTTLISLAALVGAG